MSASVEVQSRGSEPDTYVLAGACDFVAAHVTVAQPAFGTSLAKFGISSGWPRSGNTAGSCSQKPTSCF